MQKRRRRELLDALERIGVSNPVLSDTRGSHIKIEFEHLGYKIVYVTGGSPSDKCAINHMKSDIKRKMTIGVIR